MQIKQSLKLLLPLCILCVIQPFPLFAQPMAPSAFAFSGRLVALLFLWVLIIALVIAALILKKQSNELKNIGHKRNAQKDGIETKEFINNISSNQIERYLTRKRKYNKSTKPGSNAHVIIGTLFLTAISMLFSTAASAQQTNTAGDSPFWSGSGIIITVVLLLVPIVTGVVLLVVKVTNSLKQYRNKQRVEEAEKLALHLNALPGDSLEATLQKRKEALDFHLQHLELSGTQQAEDTKGLIHLNINKDLPIVALKKKAIKRPNIDPKLSKLILWYFGCATFWLLFGTTVGEYLGIKFVAPDADHVSWLSFGRLRPVHTNAVFWGWASLAMLGLGYYIVPTVSNTKLASIKKGWYALFLINAAVILGSICLMAGINNGGGEYREYIWPVMLLFGIGLILTLINFLQTIAKRTTREIYIANWYIVAATIFAIVISIVAYVPLWQDGLGETIIQGYYMHQGVGMWFMLFTLGIVYYMLPQQLNKPIYSYSLGILAFWTQILFYTLIGTHHFVFSSIPWWLQTVAIVGSVGMIIPVVAGTTNFIMTFKGAWYKIKDSYTLPFFIVGIIFYFTGSMQGTAEAFRSSNMVWHFTDFTVAHSHLTMYGIICFFLWASIYAIIPRLTGKEAPQLTIGAHFWLALIGLMFYTIPLMYGSTLKGLMWMDGKPFIDSVVLMAPYWLWRAIGGSLMWLSHLFFAYNMYKMLAKNNTVDVTEIIIQELEKNEPPLTSAI